MLVDKYDERIHERLVTLGVPDFEKDVVKNKWQKDWKFPPNSWTFWQHEPSADLVLELSPNTISIVMPTFHRPEALKEAVKSVLQQTHTDWILYIIGDACPDLEGIMTGDTMMWDPRIRYWNLPENTKEGGTTPRNYALKMLVTTDYVAYLDDDNTWRPNHLETLWRKMMENPSQQFVFSSFQSGEYTIRCKEPIRFRIDTSAILHKRTLLEKHGYWRTQTEVGYAHDFELVSRWKDEVWGATLLPTLIYNNVHQDMKSVYEAYPDQD
jgi:glycosyltransferase involved in cell wall biosynthesis